jgi:hypothetical protein
MFHTNFTAMISAGRKDIQYSILEPRTIEFNARNQYGEDHSTELYQRMQHSHEQYRQLASEHADEAIDRNTKDHKKGLSKQIPQRRMGPFRRITQSLAENYTEICILSANVHLSLVKVFFFSFSADER